MRWTIPLIFLGLAACDAPLEEAFPPQSFSFAQDGRTMDVRAQFDPLEYGWFVRVSDRNGRLELTDRPGVLTLVTQQVGPDLCEGAGMDLRPGNVITGFGAPRERYLPSIGEWQFVATCA